MLIKEQLKSFLKSGVLQNVDFGISRVELTDLLGETDWKHFSLKKDKYPSIYKYGRLEFYFENGDMDARLNGIMFQPIPSPADNGLLKCSYNRWRSKTDIAEAIKSLKINNIKYEERPYEWDNETKLLFTEGQVNIFFDCQEEPGHYVLHKAGRFVQL
jgi:hypothetical protein